MIAEGSYSTEQQQLDRHAQRPKKRMAATPSPEIEPDCVFFDALSDDFATLNLPCDDGLPPRLLLASTIHTDPPAAPDTVFAVEAERAARPLSLLFDDGTYVGDIVGGKAHGRGERRWTSGDDGGNIYQGGFINGMKEGSGVLLFADGEIYDGDWKADRREGRGKETWADGSGYEGEFRQGKKEGRGKMKYANGDIYDGDWRDGKFEGKGKMAWHNGNVYEGDFRHGKKDGRGKETFADGETYDGDWKADKREGLGILKNRQKKLTQRGVWRDDIFVGSG